MSTGARIAIAIVGLFFAAMGAIMALESGKWAAWLPTIFCVMMSVACIRGRVGTVALRGTAASIFALCAWYLLSEVTQGDMGSGSRAEASLPNAIKAFVIFGLPFGYLAVFGFYPPWARFGKHLNGRKSASESEAPSEHSKQE